LKGGSTVSFQPDPGDRKDHEEETLEFPEKNEDWKELWIDQGGEG
jgi:hypothetical protein